MKLSTRRVATWYALEQWARFTAEELTLDEFGAVLREAAELHRLGSMIATGCAN